MAMASNNTVATGSTTSRRARWLGAFSAAVLVLVGSPFLASGGR